MGKVLILFDSATGNTAKMAALVAEGAARVEGTEVRLLRVESATGEDILWCDGIAVGSPTNVGLLSHTMKRFWDDLVDSLWGRIDGRIGCAFSSSGGWGGGAELACQSILTMLMNFGFLVFGVTDYVATRHTLHYGAVVAGEPRTADERESCLRLGERLAQWVAVFQDHNTGLLPHTGARRRQ